MNHIVEPIIRFYLQNSRPLPWRETSDPYKIWLSEIILQQTRVEQGLPYYLRFIDAFPDVETLAAANEEKVLLLWQGLGYYSRARNLHQCAKIVFDKYDGSFPQDFKLLLSLPGIGPYTAAAIGSFAFGLKHPAIDGNVGRVISRIFGIEAAPNSLFFRKKVEEISFSMINHAPAGLYNQAMMEYGAVICTPSAPKCALCEIRSSCFAFENRKVNSLPLPKPKKEQIIRYFYYLIIHHDDKIYIEKRLENDIWKGLFQFPLIETKEALNLGQIEANIKSMPTFEHYSITKITEEIPHKLSHRLIKARFIHLQLSENQRNDAVEEWNESYKNPNWIETEIEGLVNYAVPQLIKNYVKKTN